MNKFDKQIVARLDGAVRARPVDELSAYPDVVIVGMARDVVSGMMVERLIDRHIAGAFSQPLILAIIWLECLSRSFWLLRQQPR